MLSTCVFCGSSTAEHNSGCPNSFRLRAETGYSSPVVDAFSKVNLRNDISRYLRPHVKNVRMWWIESPGNGDDNPLALLWGGRMDELLDRVESVIRP